MVTAMSTAQLRRWTRQEYDRMIAAGVLEPEDQVELIEGEILTMTPQRSPHATAVLLAQEALRGALGSGLHVRSQLPLALGQASEPEPDVAVVAGGVRDYSEGHPQRALLVVEVADTTLAYDRDVKGSLYARFEIPEYWLVNLREGCVEVYRDPTTAPQARFGWHYRSVTRAGQGESISPASWPSAPIAVADLLP
jgi:Uma2 family endonuclease